jgi:co-chaperonin GroES (HSP10)
LGDGKIKALVAKVSDRVLYGKDSGAEVHPKENDEEFLIMHEDGISAIININDDLRKEFISWQNNDFK